MLKITWLGQSGYLLSDGTTKICIDPYLSDSVNRIASKPRMRKIPIEPEKLDCDAVICTHNHLDHLDIDAIPRMNKSIAFYAPSDCKETLIKLGVEKIFAFDENASYTLGAFKITAVFAEHTVPAVGVTVEYGKTILYFSGDTFYNTKLESIKCDCMFICINGKLGNMNVTDAVKLTNVIKPKIAIPNHYDMFESNSEDPKKFTDNVEKGIIMDFDREYEVKDCCLI